MTESSNGTGRADVAAETVTRLLTLSGFEPSLKTTENEERIGISIELGADDIPPASAAVAPDYENPGNSVDLHKVTIEKSSALVSVR